MENVYEICIYVTGENPMTWLCSNDDPKPNYENIERIVMEHLQDFSIIKSVSIEEDDYDAILRYSKGCKHWYDSTMHEVVTIGGLRESIYALKGSDYKTVADYFENGTFKPLREDEIAKYAE